jgi:hypothetical protein
MNTVDTVVENPAEIDVLSFLDGAEYPTREVVVFTDVKSADEYVRLNGRDDLDSDGEAELAELQAKVRKSAIIFHLRGMAPGIVNDLYTKNGDDEPETEKENRLVASTVYKVTNGDGAEDKHAFTEDSVIKLRRYLKEGEFGKLIKGVIEVNFDANLFDRAVDAGFSSGRTESAA